jgi:Lrp/AsnC family transcriptional regulator of ectoine degradation
MAKLGLDKTDIRILSAVQSHGQLSKTRLAELVNLSPTPCLARLTRLKSEGFILGYHADIALNRIVDFTQVVVTVSLSQHRKADFERFEAHINALDEVTDCIATGGGMDYVLTVVTPSLAQFQIIMDAMLAEELNIGRYMTYIVTKRVKASRPNITKLMSKAGVQPDKD